MKSPCLHSTSCDGSILCDLNSRHTPNNKCDSSQSPDPEANNPPEEGPLQIDDKESSASLDEILTPSFEGKDLDEELDLYNDSSFNLTRSTNQAPRLQYLVQQS
jgi:hypothetical protein